MKKLREFFSKAEHLYLLLFVVFIIPFSIYIKPWQTTDEPNQFLRAYEISEGKLVVNNNLDYSLPDSPGGFIKQTSSRLEFPKSIADFYNSFFVKGNYVNYSVGNALKVGLNSKTIGKIENTNINQYDGYSPVGYIPQAVAILLLKPFNASPVLLSYGMRLLSIIVWCLFMYFAIKILPIRKWALMFFGLMPPVLQIVISNSADSLSIAPAALMVAIIIRSFYSTRTTKQNVFDIVSLTFLATIASQAKPNLLPIIILIPFYFINAAKNNEILKLRLMKFAAPLFPLLSYYLWSKVSAMNHVGVTNIYKVASNRISQIKSSPFEAVQNFMLQGFNYLKIGGQLIGDRNLFEGFKWGNIFVGTPVIVVLLSQFILGLIIVIGYKDNTELLPKVSKKYFYSLNLGMLISAIGIVFASWFVSWIIWIPDQFNALGGLQARYYLAAILLLIVLPMNRRIRSSAGFFIKFTVFSSILMFTLSFVMLLIAR